MPGEGEEVVGSSDTNTVESIVAALATSFPSLGPELAQLSPPPGATLKYGTAGFRTRAELLDSTFLRMGVLAALRSRFHGNNTAGGSDLY